MMFVIYFALDYFVVCWLHTNAPFTQLRFCYDAFFESKLPAYITQFLYKNEQKNIRFCAFTLICLITNTEPKISVLCVHIAPVFRSSLLDITALSKTSVFVHSH